MNNNDSSSKELPKKYIIYCPDELSDSIICRLPGNGYLPLKLGFVIQVNENQQAYLYHNGKVLDKFEPGRHEITKDRISKIIASLSEEEQANDIYDVQVYYVTTVVHHNVKWGTPRSIYLNHPKLGPIFIQAYGSYSISVNDPIALIQYTSGLHNYVYTEFQSLLRSELYSALRQLIISTKIRADRDVNQMLHKLEISSSQIPNILNYKLAAHGITIPNIIIENIGLDDFTIEKLWRQEENRIGIESTDQKYLDAIVERMDRLDNSNVSLKRKIDLFITILRIVISMVFFMSSVLALVYLPRVLSWTWLLSHDSLPGIYISTIIIIAAIAWIIADSNKSRRLFIVTAILISAMFTIIQLL